MSKIHFSMFSTPFLRRLLVLGLCVARLRAAEQAPDWWSARGVISTNAANDYAALNGGQLKNLAYSAWLELEALPGGAGFEPAFTNNVTNYAVVNLGQLKEAAKPFYDRLGLSGQYPWSGLASSGDCAIALIGQAKYLFSFDPLFIGDIDQDGLPDHWELANGCDVYLNADSYSDSDGDGLSNLDEYLLGADPNSPGGASPPATAASSQVFGPGVTGLLILTPSATVR